MNEDFLHYIWQFKRFNTRNLYTTEKEEIKIHKAGYRNSDAGPDFCDAIISIGGIKWVGNVEIHINSSDWNAHQHHLDKAYDTVILHVVYNDDKTVCRKNKEMIPTLVLKGIFDEQIYEKYIHFLDNKQWVPCMNLFKSADSITTDLFLTRLFFERIERKANTIIETLKVNKNNIDETFYYLLARNFGFGLNADPFGQVARSLPLTVLLKHKHDIFQTEALLFGQAGMLNNNFTDDYPKALKKEYSFLRKKYQLRPVDGSIWKFLRLRPSNFPTIRIAQFASLISKSSALFSKIIEEESLNSIYNCFECKCSTYWNNHFNFEKKSGNSEKNIGEAAKQLIVINTVVPFLFVYGIIKGEDSFKNRALNLMENTGPEENNVTRKWAETGIIARNASESQALMELKDKYCKQLKCLQCSIGNQILKN